MNLAMFLATPVTMLAIYIRILSSVFDWPKTDGVWAAVQGFRGEAEKTCTAAQTSSVLWPVENQWDYPNVWRFILRPLDFGEFLMRFHKGRNIQKPRKYEFLFD